MYHYYIQQNIEALANGLHFADGIFKCIFLNENVYILIYILLKFVPKHQLLNIHLAINHHCL